MPDALAGNVPGREAEDERIPGYNIGIALHDIVFARGCTKSADARGRSR